MDVFGSVWAAGPHLPVQAVGDGDRDGVRGRKGGWEQREEKGEGEGH